jgi:hypothetical protein
MSAAQRSLSNPFGLASWGLASWGLASRGLTHRRLAALTATLLLAGCQTEPIYDVDRAIIPTERGWTLEDMTRAIQRAGARRGWDMRIIEPGVIEGRLRKPQTRAVVDVTYTAVEFSIRYQSSENLDHSNGKIHHNYNRWVYNLERDIRREFLRMRPTYPAASDSTAGK